MRDREFSLLPVDSIQVGTRIRREVGDVEGLKQSIQEVGLLHPIVVTAENRLLAGYRRLRAFIELGRTAPAPPKVTPEPTFVFGCEAGMGPHARLT